MQHACADRHLQIALTGAGRAIVAWDEIVSGVRRAATVALRVGDTGTATFETPRLLAADAAAASSVILVQQLPR